MEGAKWGGLGDFCNIFNNKKRHPPEKKGAVDRTFVLLFPQPYFKVGCTLNMHACLCVCMKSNGFFLESNHIITIAETPRRQATCHAEHCSPGP